MSYIQHHDLRRGSAATVSRMVHGNRMYRDGKAIGLKYHPTNISIQAPFQPSTALLHLLISQDYSFQMSTHSDLVRPIVMEPAELEVPILTGKSLLQ